MKVAGNCNLMLKNLTIEEVIAINALLKGMRLGRRGLPEKAQSIRPRGRPAKTIAPVPSGEKPPFCDDRELVRKAKRAKECEILRENEEDDCAEMEIALKIAKCGAKA